jgi:hypothetical protein
VFSESVSLSKSGFLFYHQAVLDNSYSFWDSTVFRFSNRNPKLCRLFYEWPELANSYPEQISLLYFAPIRLGNSPLYFTKLHFGKIACAKIAR